MKEQTEVWKEIPGYDNYAVSDQGRVMRIARGRSTHPGKILRPARNTRGYSNVVLCHECLPKTFTVHTLVMLAFVGPRPEGMEVNHINGVKTNNRLSNLEYVTPQENSLHATRVLGKRIGEAAGSAKLTEAQVLEMRAEYDGKRGSCAKLARKYGVDHRTIRLAVNGKTWTHI